MNNLINKLIFIFSKNKKNEIIKCKELLREKEIQITELMRERLIYLQKNNEMSNFMISIIKQYAPIEQKAELLEKVNRDFPINQKVFDEEKEFKFIIKFKLNTTLFDNREEDIKSLKNIAKNLGLSNIEINSLYDNSNFKKFLLIGKGKGKKEEKRVEKLQEIIDGMR